MAFNLVVLTGRLTADVELKVTPSGKNVCSFSIAVDRGYGENKTTDFINIVAWNGSAEFISKYFGRGDMIGIEGSIQTRKYTDKNGNNRTVFEVVASNIQFIGGKKDNTEETQEDPLVDFSNQVNEANSMIDDLPF